MHCPRPSNLVTCHLYFFQNHPLKIVPANLNPNKWGVFLLRHNSPVQSSIHSLAQTQAIIPSRTIYLYIFYYSTTLSFECNKGGSETASVNLDVQHLNIYSDYFFSSWIHRPGSTAIRIFYCLIHFQVIFGPTMLFRKVVILLGYHYF